MSRETNEAPWALVKGGILHSFEATYVPVNAVMQPYKEYVMGIYF